MVLGALSEEISYKRVAAQLIWFIFCIINIIEQYCNDFYFNLHQTKQVYDNLSCLKGGRQIWCPSDNIPLRAKDSLFRLSLVLRHNPYNSYLGWTVVIILICNMDWNKYIKYSLPLFINDSALVHKTIWAAKGQWKRIWNLIM